MLVCYITISYVDMFASVHHHVPFCQLLSTLIFARYHALVRAQSASLLFIEKFSLHNQVAVEYPLLKKFIINFQCGIFCFYVTLLNRNNRKFCIFLLIFLYEAYGLRNFSLMALKFNFGEL